MLYEYVGGVKNNSTHEPVKASTAFEAASISKPMFAYIVYSLMRDGTVDLDASVSTLVPEIPELAYDPRSATLTPRLLLTHQGGLPNWRSRIDFAAKSYDELFAPDDTLKFIAEPGTEYNYSGEGYVLLQRMIETHTGLGLNDLAKDRVFEPLGMTASSFFLDTDVRGDYSLGHNGEGAPDKWEVHLPLTSSTLHTTASDLALFGVHLASEIRTAGPYSALTTPVITVGTDGDRTLSWGLGLGIMSDGPRRYVYHGGNNVIFIADLMYGIDANVGYALLTNSSNGQAIVEAVERRIFGSHVRR